MTLRQRARAEEEPLFPAASRMPSAGPEPATLPHKSPLSWSLAGSGRCSAVRLAASWLTGAVCVVIRRDSSGTGRSSCGALRVARAAADARLAANATASPAVRAGWPPESARHIVPPTALRAVSPARCRCETSGRRQRGATCPLDGRGGTSARRALIPRLRSGRGAERLRPRRRDVVDARVAPATPAAAPHRAPRLGR